MSYLLGYQSDNETIARPKQVDVIVIGAGLSGLAAAYSLHKHSIQDPLRLLVLEAENRVGGRAYTVALQTCDGTDSFDLGLQFASNKHAFLHELLRELHIETLDCDSPLRNVVQLGKNRFGDFPEKRNSIDGIDFRLAMKKIDDLCQRCATAKNFAFANGTLLQHAKKICLTKNVRKFLNLQSLIHFGLPASELPMLYFLKVCHSFGSAEAMFCEQQTQRVSSGLQPLAQLLAEAVGSDNIILNQEVRQITKEGSLLLVKTDGGRKFACRRLVLAISPQEAAKINYTPPLEPAKIKLLNSIPYPAHFTFVLTYASAFWRTEGFSGHVIICNKENPAFRLADSTSQNGNAALIGWIHPLWKNTEREIRARAIIKQIAQFFGAEAYDFLEYYEKSFESLQDIEASPDLSQIFQENVWSSGANSGIHWAGSFTASKTIRTANGAIESGKRAAYEVLKQLAPVINQEHLLLTETEKLKRKSS